ncbi:MAG: hypothetical protein ACOX8R_07120 [Bacillota bacterium]
MKDLSRLFSRANTDETRRSILNLPDAYTIIKQSGDKRNTEFFSSSDGAADPLRFTIFFHKTIILYSVVKCNGPTVFAPVPAASKGTDGKGKRQSGTGLPF